jgi:hypothetical protein
MPAHYFTVSEANEILTEIKPLMAELLERRARVVRARQEVAPILGDLTSNMGSYEATAIAQDFVAIEQLIRRIQAYGCELKDMNVGLLDFLSERNGREIYLCWRYGEERIEYFHELHTGYNGRRQL